MMAGIVINCMTSHVLKPSSPHIVTESSILSNNSKKWKRGLTPIYPSSLNLLFFTHFYSIVCLILKTHFCSTDAFHASDIFCLQLYLEQGNKIYRVSYFHWHKYDWQSLSIKITNTNLNLQESSEVTKKYLYFW